MEEGSKKSEPSASKVIESIDDDIDMSELDRIEKIIEKDASEELRLISFEKQMFLDCVYNDGLVICAK